MSYLGDIRIGDTIDHKFTTRQFSTGIPFTFAGTPAVAAYVGNGTTEITTGVTLTVDFDGRTGLNNVRVVATIGNGFAAGTNVHIVITAGTVDGVSIVGEAICSFSIEARSAVMPTVAGRTMDVSTTGEVDSNVTQIDGLETSGNNATLNLKQLNIVNSGGGAVILTSGGGFDSVKITGSGNGHGIYSEGGNAGSGIVGMSGTTTGSGIAAISVGGSGGPVSGFTAVGSNGGSGISGRGHGSGAGISATGGTTGPGALFSGGATSGIGIDANGTGGAADIEGTLTGSVTGDLGGNVVGNVNSNVMGNVEGDLNGTLAALSTNALTSILGRFLLLKDELVSTVVTSTTVTLTGEYSPVTNAFAGCVLINKASDTTLKQVRNIVSSQTSGGVTELTIDGTWLTNPIDGDTITIYEGGHPVIGDFGSAAQTDISSAVWSRVIDGTRTSEELLRGIVAALLGKSSDHAAGTPKYRNIADTKDVISATTDSDGNRTSVTTDLS